MRPRFRIDQRRGLAPITCHSCRLGAARAPLPLGRRPGAYTAQHDTRDAQHPRRRSSPALMDPSSAKTAPAEALHRLRLQTSPRLSGPVTRLLNASRKLPRSKAGGRLRRVPPPTKCGEAAMHPLTVASASHRLGTRKGNEFAHHQVLCKARLDNWRSTYRINAASAGTMGAAKIQKSTTDPVRSQNPLSCAWVDAGIFPCAAT